MANLMSMVKLRNKVSRNGFDLSRKNVFSAKVGELLPVSCIECIPGDKHRIEMQSFSRTQPVNTAAYTRIREYYDWFFVPSNLLWNKFNTWVTQMGKNGMHAMSSDDSQTLNDRLPYFKLSNLVTMLNARSSANNIFGYKSTPLSAKLLSYLDYGLFPIDSTTGKIKEEYNYNVNVNPFPLLAYQKIYTDYFRNSQWERPFAPSFNIDYSVGGSIDTIVQDEQLGASLAELQYCNWNKDLIMGVLPSAQYGSTAAVNGASVIKGSNIGSLNLSASAVESLAKSMGLPVTTTDEGSIIQMFNILQLRQAEAKQKWAEITQSQQQDYKSQVQAHFNVNVSDAYSERCTYVGGTASNIDISEVVNTNLSSLESEAAIAGKGVGSGRGFVDFECNVHGYLMCIYHAVPLLDYANSGIDKTNLKTLPVDFAIPEFDKVGMSQLSLREVSNRSGLASSLNSLLGYVPRYYEYKTALDKVHGAFVDGGLDSWVAPFSDNYIESILNTVYTSSLFVFFKVNPAVLNPIFLANVDSFTSTDQLLINSYFDIKSVRNLDVNGLPY